MLVNDKKSATDIQHGLFTKSHCQIICLSFIYVLHNVLCKRVNDKNLLLIYIVENATAKHGLFAKSHSKLFILYSFRFCLHITYYVMLNEQRHIGFCFHDGDAIKPLSINKKYCFLYYFTLTQSSSLPLEHKAPTSLFQPARPWVSQSSSFQVFTASVICSSIVFLHMPGGLPLLLFQAIPLLWRIWPSHLHLLCFTSSMTVLSECLFYHPCGKLFQCCCQLR